MQDIVNRLSIISSPNFSDLSHPLVDVNDCNKQLTVSVFNCPPHIVYLDDAGSRMDGMEYRFLKHVLKNWKIKFLQQNETLIPFNPFASMLNQLAKGYSEMVMCGVWLNVMLYDTKDLTSYFDYNCNTWIAPKPDKIDPATLIYLALSTPVWGLYVFCFAVTVILLTILSKIEEDIKKTKIVSSNFGRTLLEAANTATSHGMMNFPKQISVQILLISWILLNLLVGLGYTTIYSSRLTRPGYTKPIDTFEDFVERGNANHIESKFIYHNEMYKGITWVTRHEYNPVLTSLNESMRPAFHSMYENYFRVDTEEQLVNNLRTGRYGVFMSIRSHKYAVDIERITHPSSMDIWKLFRFMKECFYSHFSTFALPKHSPYTALFNAHIKRYQECGLIKKWYTELYAGKTWMNTLFDTQNEHDHEPNALELWDMKGAFFILLAGLTVATASFLLESAYFKLKINFVDN